MKILSYLIMLFCVLHLSAQPDLESIYNQSISAYEQKDYVTFLNKTKSADELRPNHPSIVYNLAAAYALNNDLEQSIKILKQLFLMNPDVNIEKDADFNNVVKTPEYIALKVWIEQNNQPIQNSEVALRFDDKSLHPEGFAIDPKTGNYFFGGFHDQKIVKIDPVGNVTDWVKAKKVTDMYGVTGVAFDEKQQLLWACSTSTDEILATNESSQAGTSSALVFDLEGNLLKSALINEGNFFGDLILRKDGSVLISDSQANKIFSFSLDDELNLWADFSKELLNVQGITFDKKEKMLFVADYLTGIYRYELSTKSLKKIDLPDTVSEKGFDGIYYYKRSIIAIQNGSKPNRVYQFSLDKTQTKIDHVNVIDQALPVFDEPTQGTIVKRHFYYLANSPWQHYEDGKLLIDEVPETVILKYALK